MIDVKSILDKVVVGVITAVVLGALALFWNWSSSGGLVRALGGATPQDVEAAIKRLAVSGPPGPPGPKGEPGTNGPASVPPGAVVAFDLPGGCPPGWSTFKAATARAIVGEGDQFEVGMDSDQFGEHLTPQKYRGHGGTEKVAIKMENLPRYVVSAGTRVVQVQGGTSYYVRHLDGPEPWTLGAIGPSNGLSLPVEIKPPFVALYYCKIN